MSARSRPIWWICSLCEARYDIDEVDYTCPACGAAGLLDLGLDHERLRASGATTQAPLSLWRYLPLLPLSSAPTAVRGDVGGTALIASAELARAANVAALAIKDEGRNPSGSLKDRASTVVTARAIELGRTRVVASSSGNAAVALAAAAAGTSVRAVTFVPSTIPAAKLAQLVAFGAEVMLVDGGYERAVKASQLATEQLGWYSRNTAANPFTTQGKKTVALEIAEQAHGPIDVVVVPAGDGNIITGVHAGFRDAVALGWLSNMPRLIAVQGAGADAIYHAWASGLEVPEPRGGTSIAHSINVADPQDGRRALRAVRETGGGVVRVDEQELGDAIMVLASRAGVFSEPAAAMAWPGLLAARREGLVGRDDRVVLINTGHGLSDTSRVPMASNAMRTLTQDVELLDQVNALGGC